MLDYGYTPEALLNNFEIIGVDAKKIDALIVSHGHFDHYGGLIGFLDKYRGALPADVKLYAGGEDNFCHRLAPTGKPGEFSDFGYLDRTRAGGAESRRRAVREPNRHRRACLYHRADQTPDRRKNSS